MRQAALCIGAFAENSQFCRESAAREPAVLVRERPRKPDSYHRVGFARAQSCGPQVCRRRPVDLRTKGERPPVAKLWRIAAAPRSGLGRAAARDRTT